MKATELHQMQILDLEKELDALLNEQFKLRMQQASGQLTKPHLVKNVRKSIARIKTILTGKQVRSDE